MSRRTTAKRSVVALVLLGLLAWYWGYSQKPNLNIRVDPRIMQEDVPTSDTLIWIAFSGGGTRAAATAWKTLEALKSIPIEIFREGHAIQSNLADEIDVISGISGG